MKKKALIVSTILLLIPINAFAVYYSLNEIKVTGKIAEPIILFEEIDQYQNVEFYKGSTKEYKFKIKNYYLDNSNLKRINNVNLSYNLEIIYNSDFPIEVELYDSNNKELLKGENTTPQMNLKNGIESEDIYKLIVYWNEKEKMSANTDISIKVNASQIKELE